MKCLRTRKLNFKSYEKFTEPVGFITFIMSADMRKCLRTRFDDNKMSTFSHVIWITVKTLGANIYCDFGDKFMVLSLELEFSLHFG